MSGCIIGFLIMILRRIDMHISAIGTNRIYSGTTIDSIVSSFEMLMIDNNPSLNPMNMLPASPMNIIAGVLLYGINPAIAPPSESAIGSAKTLLPCSAKIIAKAITATKDK